MNPSVVAVLVAGRGDIGRFPSPTAAGERLRAQPAGAAIRARSGPPWPLQQSRPLERTRSAGRERPGRRPRPAVPAPFFARIRAPQPFNCDWPSCFAPPMALARAARLASLAEALVAPRSRRSCQALTPSERHRRRQIKGARTTVDRHSPASSRRLATGRQRSFPVVRNALRLAVTSPRARAQIRSLISSCRCHGGVGSISTSRGTYAASNHSRPSRHDRAPRASEMRLDTGPDRACAFPIRPQGAGSRSGPARPRPPRRGATGAGSEPATVLTLPPAAPGLLRDSGCLALAA